MSLEKLMITSFKDWDEFDTGEVFLMGVAFTPRFSQFIWDEFGKALDVGDWTIAHSFGKDFPVVVSSHDDDGEVLVKLEITTKLFATFLLEYAKHD